MGASSSDDTKHLEKYAEYRQLALVSYQATAPELSDVEMFPNLLRTIPPDNLLTKVGNHAARMIYKHDAGLPTFEYSYQMIFTPMKG